MIEWGIFSDEGLVEDGFQTEVDATRAILENYSPDDDLEALEICPDHEDQPNRSCEDCMGEEEE